MSSADSPLHIAIRDNNVEIIKLLLEGKCDVHAVNAEGMTPLQLATQMGNAEMIALLFQHGAGNQPKPGPHSVSTPVIDTGGHLPVDVIRRKKRITFWTVFCMASYVLFVGALFFMNDANLTLKEANLTRNALVEQETSAPEEMELSLQEMDGIIAHYSDNAIMAFVIFNVVGLAYLYIFNMYVFRLWEEVPTEFARTTPWKASSFSLIPVFNWFWWFVAFVGLYKDMNKAMESYGLGTRFGLAWIRTACVCWVIFDLCVGISGIFWVFKLLITIPTYWIIRNRVLEFVDIKARMGMNDANIPNQ